MTATAPDLTVQNMRLCTVLLLPLMGCATALQPFEKSYWRSYFDRERETLVRQWGPRRTLLISDPVPLGDAYFIEARFAELPERKAEALLFALKSPETKTLGFCTRGSSLDEEVKVIKPDGYDGSFRCLVFSDGEIKIGKTACKLAELRWEDGG